MKRLFLFFGAAAWLASCGNTDASGKMTQGDSATQQARLNAIDDTASYTSIQWLDSVHQNIGNVKTGQVAEIAWHLKNTGDKPLVIARVSPGCGCTVADKPEEPIMPGGESVIRAKFNSAGQHEGEHLKYISVSANTKNTTSYQLSFKVTVTK